MRQLADIENELDAIGARFWLIGRRSVRELPNILVYNEKIQFCLSGRYSGGFAVVCVTNLRILLIDRKPFFLTLEDIRYDMIMEVDYSYQAFNSTIKIFVPNKSLTFTAYKKHDLRRMTRYIQKQVIANRHQHSLEQQAISNEQPSMQSTSPVGATPGITAPVAVLSSASADTGESFPISIPQAINPYIKSTLTVRRRSSRL